MLEQRTALENIKHRTTLYRVVFESAFVKSAVFGLFVFLLLQPVAPAFAAFDNVDSESSQSVTTVTSTDSEPENVQDVIAVTSSQNENFDVLVQDSDLLTENDDSVLSQENVESITMTEATPENEATNTDENIDSNTGNTIVDDSTSTSSLDEQTELPVESVAATTTDDVSTSTTTEETAEIIDEEIETASTTPVVDEVIIDDIATSTESVATSTDENVVFVGASSAAFEFDSKECTSVGDGAYYCSDAEKVVDPLKDGIFSAPDSEGDLEIYVRLGGQESIITSNSTDDSAPYFDALSKRIVWHRVIDDRYQIVSYDTNTNEETVLTHTTYNNMEPVAYENITLWQAWIDSNWEIMMFDGEKSVQLTNNTLQDVSPHMREGYIVWQTQFSEGWQVAVYNQETKTIEYIPSESGLKVENPRFVLVYDSTDDNGDKQTLGYDLDNKTSFALGSLPAELPDELPDPDQTGETRALIQNKQTSREGENEVIDIPQIGSNNQTGSTSTSTNGIGDLDLTGNGTTTVIYATSSAPVDIVDVVIPSYAATSTESQEVSDIPDIVIPPSLSTTTEEVS